MRDHHKSFLAVARTIFDADRVRAMLDQFLPVLAPGLICLPFACHDFGIVRLNEAKFERLHHRIDGIENAPFIRSGEMQANNFSRFLVDNDRAGVSGP
jgi:hypothetical protein